MVVHHVEMHDVGPGGEDVVDFLAEPGEIGGENARGNPEGLGHGELLKGDEAILPTVWCGGFRNSDGGHKPGASTR
jgi:hypothetical protein